MLVKGELYHILMVIAEPFFVGTDPDDTSIVLIQGGDTILTKAFRIFTIVGEVAKMLLFFVDDVETTMVGTYPDQALVILDYTAYDVIIQTIVLIIVGECFCALVIPVDALVIAVAVQPAVAVFISHELPGAGCGGGELIPGNDLLGMRIHFFQQAIGVDDPAKTGGGLCHVRYLCAG